MRRSRDGRAARGCLAGAQLLAAASMAPVCAVVAELMCRLPTLTCWRISVSIGSCGRTTRMSTWQRQRRYGPRLKYSTKQLISCQGLVDMMMDGEDQKKQKYIIIQPILPQPAATASAAPRLHLDPPNSSPESSRAASPPPPSASRASKLPSTQVLPSKQALPSKQVRADVVGRCCFR